MDNVTVVIYLGVFRIDHNLLSWLQFFFKLTQMHTAVVRSFRHEGWALDQTCWQASVLLI